jgi:hypothetical protein
MEDYMINLNKPSFSVFGEGPHEAHEGSPPHTQSDIGKNLTFHRSEAKNLTFHRREECGDVSVMVWLAVGRTWWRRRGWPREERGDVAAKAWLAVGRVWW